MRIVFSLLMDNTPGVLSRIAGLFTRRGYNIESITAGVTADPRFTRMTVVSTGDHDVLEQIEPFNPYRKVPAATMAWGYGLKTRPDAEQGVVLNNLDAGETLLIKGVDFGARGARSLTACVNAPEGGSIEVRLDSADGPLAGTLTLKPGTGWKQQTARLSGAAGVHDLVFVFQRGGFEWAWWQMK